WIHRRGVIDAAAMTNLPARLRAALGEAGLAPGLCVPERVHRSADGTRKIAVRLRDGALIETVLLPAVSGPSPAPADDEDEDEGPSSEHIRVTQCISTQVGCAMGCTFCASGVAGLKRHLGPEEIVAQVLLGRSLLDEGEALRNVVYMGM